MKVVMMYRRRWGLLYMPVVLAASLLVFWLGTSLVTLPPTELTIAAGVPTGGYAQLAEQYRTELAKRGIQVHISTGERGTPGSRAPLERLANPRDEAAAGFAHGLLADWGPEAPVRALAVVGRQPLWIFTRIPTATSLGQMRGLRLAAGPVGSPQRRIAESLMTRAGLRSGEVTWSDLQGLAAATALLEQNVDVVFTIASADAPSIRQLTSVNGIGLVGLDRVGAVSAADPRLQAFVLPQGAIELRGDLPPRDIAMVYTNTHLLVRENMHPALQRALLDAAVEIHSVASFMQRQAEYPAFDGTDFPLSPVATHYTSGQRPWLENALPYWWAQATQLVLVVVLPVLFVMTLALMWIPRFFSLRVSSALAHYYGEVMFLETDLDKDGAEQPARMRELLARLDAIEREVLLLDLPDHYAHRWYTLREHLVKARERVLQMRTQAGPTGF